MIGSAANFVWERLRMLNRIPGAHALYKTVSNLIYRDGKLVTLRRGPAAGYRWRHYRCYQPWMAMGLYEPHVAKLIHDQLKDGDVFYDIGANAGYFTLVAARVVGATGKVVAFDPNPVNVKTIREQVALNGLDQVCAVEPLAISDQCGTFSFVLTAVNANAHLESVDALHVKEFGEAIKVTAVTLDQYAANNPKPSLIKMDIEGAEVAALNGARDLLGRYDAPVFLVSTHSDELEDGVKSILGQNGYVFQNLEGFEQMVYALPPGMSRSLLNLRTE